MSDPMDQYSKPIKTTETKLGILFEMEPRRKPKKPGRELIVNFDDRFPIINDFQVHYSYFVRFLEAGNFAGNHYHQKKQELFVPITGQFDVHLEDPKSEESEIITIDAAKYQVFYIKPQIAHKVVAKQAGNVLLVLATSANIDEDEFEYTMVKGET